MTVLSESPNEGSTFVIIVNFLDLNGTAFIPTTCVWSLTDTKGLVINARDRIAVTITGTLYSFVMSGDDLLFANDKGRRVFTVEGTYTGTYGTGLPYREEASFSCRDTVRDPI
jgi:hypothetical protein